MGNNEHFLLLRCNSGIFHFVRGSEKVKWIANYIEESLNLRELADLSCFSPFYLDRLFRTATGFPLSSYVRKRKLARSLDDLVSSELKVLHVALKYGYSHEQSFIRAFRREFGATPHKMRRGKKLVPLLDVFRGELYDISDRGILHRNRLVFLPALRLCGIPSKIHIINDPLERANMKAKEFFDFGKKSVEGKVDSHVYYAFIRSDYYGKWTNLYMPSVEVNGTRTRSNGYGEALIPAGSYHHFVYSGAHHPEDLTYKELMELYNHIFNRIEHIPFHMERLDRSLCSEDFCELEIYVPADSGLKAPRLFPGEKNMRACIRSL